MAAQQRPLSPHLQVYRPQITSMMSILHRVTGVLLALAAFVLTAWLVVSAGDTAAFDGFQFWAGSMFGKIALVSFTAALVYHFLNGIRHLLWDVGWGFELPKVYGSGYVVLGLSVIITTVLAYLGLNAGGTP